MVEDSLYIFTASTRIAELWQQLVTALLPYTGSLADMDLLFLAWPLTAHDISLSVVILLYHHLVWTTRSDARPPTLTGFGDPQGQAGPLHAPVVVGRGPLATI